MTSDLKDSAFSRQALAYHKTSQLQQTIGDKLLALLPEIEPQRILDIGCGSGQFTYKLQQRFPQAKIHGIDPAPGMLSLAKKHCPNLDFQSACAEDLPYPADYFDLIISNVALQWTDSLTKAGQEITRVVKPGGTIVFSIFYGNTLRELHTAYSQAYKELFGQRQAPLVSFYTRQEIENSCNNIELALLEDMKIVKHYENSYKLLKIINNWGAGNNHPNRPKGLGQRKLLALTEKYYSAMFAQDVGKKPRHSSESWNLNKKKYLPATWQVLFVKGQKT
jgi:malonyl-CoA O-methyltransferase